MNSATILVVGAIDGIIANEKNCEKNEILIQVLGVDDPQVPFDIAHYYRDMWKRIEILPPHNNGAMILRFCGRKVQ